MPPMGFTVLFPASGNPDEKVDQIVYQLLEAVLHESNSQHA
jgi:hypothetical protein